LSLEDDLHILDVKLKQLKLEYEQYFLGSRPRVPAMLRREVQRALVEFANTPIQNTAGRFKFNSINSRFQAFRRQWDETLRKIEAGTYTRHVFKAKIREASNDGPASTGSTTSPEKSPGELFDAYVEAARACGQKVDVTPEKLQAVIRKQGAALREKLGCSDVRFRVVVQEGKVKLKAAPVRS